MFSSKVNMILLSHILIPSVFKMRSVPCMYIFAGCVIYIYDVCDVSNVFAINVRVMKHTCMIFMLVIQV